MCYRFTNLDYMISEWALIGNIGRTNHEFRFSANYMWLILDWALIRNIVTDRDTRLMVLIRNSVTTKRKYYKFTIRYLHYSMCGRYYTTAAQDTVIITKHTQVLHSDHETYCTKYSTILYTT